MVLLSGALGPVGGTWTVLWLTAHAGPATSSVDEEPQETYSRLRPLGARHARVKLEPQAPKVNLGFVEGVGWRGRKLRAQ